MSDFRKGWRILPLIEVATLQRGYDLPVQDRTQGPHPIFAANGQVGTHGGFKATGPGVVTGRSGTIGKVHFVDQPYWPLNTSLYVKDFHGNEPKFVYHLLRQIGLEKHHEGTGVPTLNRNNIHSLPILLPPLPEQRRIAAILDQADALRAKRRAALSKLDVLAQSIFLEMFGDPVLNPRRWQCRPLDEVCRLISGATPSKSHPHFWNGNIPWFSPKDIKHDDLLDSTDHISLESMKSSRLRLFPIDTVVMVVRGMILAHSFPVSVMRREATINQDLKALLPLTPLAPQFLAANLRAQASHVLQLVSESAHGTKRLDSQAMNSIRILLPPVALQQQFSERVAKICQLRESTRRSESAMESLFTGLQTVAFQSRNHS